MRLAVLRLALRAPILAVVVFCGPATAQQSVSLFGIVDTSVRYVKNNRATWQLSDGGMAPTRLIVAGLEDLGGGYKAGFWLEGGISIDTGNGGIPSFGNGLPGGFGAFVFGRRSTVGLVTPWGTVRLGRDYTPGFWNVTIFDPFGTAGVGSAGNLFVSAEIRGIAGAEGTYATLARANNTVQYISPNGIFGPGLYGNVMVAAGEGAPANKYVGGRIGYAKAPFDVAVAYALSDVDVAGRVQLSSFNLGGSWDFGWIKLSAVVSRLDLDGLASGNATQDNWFVGAAAPIGLWNAKASFGQVRQGGIVAGNSAQQLALGLDYNLSKRTALYATGSWIDNRNTAYGVSGTGSALSRGHNSSGGEVGVRHLF